ncbi:glycosyltransferase family 4 protein [Paraferrimonas sp. SM1919]|uniref:glycosyltransferase family 4 protein n=1 Tax=Paraferrimonas sp. SM1919 TaxID=2662263 RepID=UPI0013D04B8C|nr:glycosyltransferase family 4 protein [Paraferrimonas sp. SM1919]
MIVFIAEYPNEQNSREGMMQRIYAIDELAAATDRIYLDISYKRHIHQQVNRPKPGVTVYKLNFFVHYFKIKSLIQQADVVYIHSLFNYRFVSHHLKGKRSILDLHGIVPEEFELSGKNSKAKAFTAYESDALTKVTNFVAVTHNMLRHYQKKYPSFDIAAGIVVPIFDDEIHTTTDNTNNHLTFTYAGGLHAWQNIPMMCEAILLLKACQLEQFNNYQFNLFFPERSKKKFLKRYPEIAALNNVNIASVSKNQVINELKLSHYGFILRDDIAVNNVACPTKLIEYIECNVVPITLSKNIGDFNDYGYQHVSVEDFIKGELHQDKLNTICLHNKQLLENIKNDANIAKSKLKGWLTL